MIHRQIVFVACLTVLMAGCVVPTTDRLGPPEIGAVANSRPPRVWGSRGTEEPQAWRQIVLPINRSLLVYMRRSEFTFTIYFSDCEGDVFWLDNLYLDSEPLYFAVPKENSTLEQRLGSRLNQWDAVSYVPEGEFQKREAICVEISGGNMLGMRLQKQRHRIK